MPAIGDPRAGLDLAQDVATASGVRQMSWV
jgi:hypothetical protein